MNDLELQNLLVRLTGDGSSYQRMLDVAQQQAVKAAGAIETASRRIQSFHQGIQNFASVALGALSGLGIATSFGGLISKANEFERGQIRMRAAVEANGHAMADVLPVYQEYAARMEKVSTSSKGEIMALLQQAETMGFSGDVATRLATNSIGLAGATDMEAQHALTLAIALERGNVSMLRRVPQLKGIHDETELVNRAVSLMNQGLRTQAELAVSGGGQIEKLGRSLGDISREAGIFLASYLNPLVRTLRNAIDWFRALSPEVKQTAVSFVAISAAILLINPVLSFTGTLLGALGVKAIFTTAAWVAMKVAMLATSIVVSTVQFALAALSAVGILPVVASVAILTAGFIAITGAASGLYEALSQGLAVSESVDAITGTFGEWWGYIKLIVKGMSVDFPKSVELASALFGLSMLQIRAMLPPLWDFIKAGFKITWTLAADLFADKFGDALVSILSAVTKFNGDFLRRMKPVFDVIDRVTPGVSAAVDAAIALTGVISSRMDSVVEQSLINQRHRIALARTELIAASEALNRAIIQGQSSAEINAARQTVQRLSVELENSIQVSADAKSDAFAAGATLGKHLKEGLASEKFDAALAGSAEAISRIAAYQEKTQTKTVASQSTGTTSRAAAAEEQNRKIVALQEENNRIARDELEAIQWIGEQMGLPGSPMAGAADANLQG
jgi:hypothetical protein